MFTASFVTLVCTDIDVFIKDNVFGHSVTCMQLFQCLYIPGTHTCSVFGHSVTCMQLFQCLYIPGTRTCSDVNTLLMLLVCAIQCENVC